MRNGRRSSVLVVVGEPTAGNGLACHALPISARAAGRSQIVAPIVGGAGSFGDVLLCGR
jgi:hypothetical protein